MRIWVIGTGAVAGALGRSWAQAGHEVLFTVGDRTDWDALAAETGGRYGTLAEGADAEVVLLAAAEMVPVAVPGSGCADKVLRTLGSLAGKVVIDATNPQGTMVGASGAEEVAARVPGARVVKAFNTVTAPVVAQAAAAPGRLSLLYCGDHASAKKVAAGLIVDAGFVPMDAGRLAAAREVEALGRLLVEIAYGRGPGPVGYQLLSPAELSAAGG
jgi:8-hydroxy-5-deazaflavin:NADPH oxidoreductase